MGGAGLQHYAMQVLSLPFLTDNRGQHTTSLTMPLFQDDWYEGYFIPKGTICSANIWYDSKCAFLCLRKLQ